MLNGPCFELSPNPRRSRRDTSRAIHQRADLRRPERPVVRKAVNERDRHTGADIVVADLDAITQRDHDRCSSSPRDFIQRASNVIQNNVGVPSRAAMSSATANAFALYVASSRHPRSASTRTAACSAVGCGRAYAPAYRSCETTTRSRGAPVPAADRYTARSADAFAPPDEARANDSRQCADQRVRRRTDRLQAGNGEPEREPGGCPAASERHDEPSGCGSSPAST